MEHNQAGQHQAILVLWGTRQYKMKDKKYMTISINTEKAFDKIKHQSIYDKKLSMKWI